MGEAVIPKTLGRSDGSALMYESRMILSVGLVHVLGRILTKSYEPCVGVVLLGVMGFIKNHEVDLFYLHKSIEKAFLKNGGCADYDHVFIELNFPRLLVPVIYPHIAVQVTDALVDIVSQNGSLLKNKCHAVDLLSLSIYQDDRGGVTYQKEGNARSFAVGSINQFALQDLLEKQNRDQSLSGT